MRQLVAEARRLLEDAAARLRAEILRLPDGPERGRLVQDRWQVEQMLGESQGYFSQAGQDDFLDRVVFRGRRGGTFAEIGAFNGVAGSNTLFFEMFRGWTGFMVEASPWLHAECLKNRSTPCMNVAVAAGEGEAEFLDIRKGYVQMGGLLDSLGGLARQAIKTDPRTEAEVIRVPTRSLATILRERGATRLDYLSLDIEGGELEVLRTFPFAEFEIGAWSIEVNEPTPEIGAIMESAGYLLAAYVGVDEIWVRADL